MKDYLELSGLNGPLFLLGVDIEKVKLIAWGYVTDYVSPPHTKFCYQDCFYSTDESLSKGCFLWGTEDGPHTTLDKPLILRKV